MKKLLVLCFLLISISVFSQRVNRRGLYGIKNNVVALSLAGGNSYYFGDIERTWIFSEYSKYQSNYYLEGSFSYSFYEYVNFRANILHGRLSGNRESYEFKSIIFEPALIAEYHPFKLSSPVFDFYALAGIGLTISDIRGYDITYKKDRNVSFVTPVIPFGVGYKYNFSNGLQIGAEFNFRAALTDKDNSNFDGFPYTYIGPDPKNPNKIITERRGKTSRFIDMYYVLGIRIGYKWSF
ncbi:MAG: hypothetical protein Q4A56_08755 [Porphyromonadaceae bacterium]|nr:hypothetical protein [Porphyromonadaceae bacterium]